MSTSSLIQCFSNHPAVYGCQTFTSLENILNAVNKKSFSCLDWHRYCCSHNFVNEENYFLVKICHHRYYCPFTECEEEVIPVTEVHDLPGMILAKTMPQQVSSTACILVLLSNSASRQCCEVLAPQFLFLSVIKDTVPPSDAYKLELGTGSATKFICLTAVFWFYLR